MARTAHSNLNIAGVRVVLVALWALVFTTLLAQEHPSLSEGRVFFELNDTDGDLGLQASIDGGPYFRLTIRDPRGQVVLFLQSLGSLARQGLTQLAFESAEPSFEDLSPEVFFDRFPEGVYSIVARDRRGLEFGALSELSHVLAAPPDNVQVSGIDAAEDCDAEDLPTVSEPVTVSWDPVTTSHPELGREGEVEIELYQLFVGDLAVDLPPDVTSFVVPTGFLEADEPIKFEIIARTSHGNNTAIESCFVVEQD